MIEIIEDVFALFGYLSLPIAMTILLWCIFVD